MNLVFVVSSVFVVVIPPQSNGKCVLMATTIGRFVWPAGMRLMEWCLNGWGIQIQGQQFVNIEQTDKRMSDAIYPVRDHCQKSTNLVTN